MPAAAAEQDELSAVFSALADPTRRGILRRLAAGPASVGELAEPYAMSLPAVSKHLRVLERAGLLRREKEGRVHRIHLEAAPLRSAGAYITAYQAFWEAQLDHLARYLEEDEPPSPGAPSEAL